MTSLSLSLSGLSDSLAGSLAGSDRDRRRIGPAPACQPELAVTVTVTSLRRRINSDGPERCPGQSVSAAGGSESAEVEDEAAIHSRARA
jgi:hypothetical protein